LLILSLGELDMTITRGVIVSLLTMVPLITGLCQSVGDYQTAASGDWSNIGVWQRYNGSSFVAATEFPTADNANTITIQNTHDISIDDATNGISLDQLVISSGGTLTCFGQSLLIADGAGTDLSNSGTINADDGAFEFENDALYVHARNGGSLPPGAVWNDGSECRITGVTNSPPSNLTQSFYHFTWDSNQTGNVNLNGGLSELIRGNLVISNTGSANDRLRFFTDGSDGESLTVDGNLTISGGSSVVFSVTATNCFITIGGNFSSSSSRRQTLASSASSQVTFDVTGNFENTVDLFRLTTNATASATLNLSGNMTLGGTGMSATDGSLAQINFVSGGTQTFTRTGTPSQTGALAWRVVNNSTLDMVGASFLSGSTSTSSFLLSANCKLITRAVNGSGTNNNGAIQNVTNQGTIRVATTQRTYEDDAIIEYSGSAAQQLGAGHPSSTRVHTIINNAAGVTTVGSRTISGDLSLSAGSLTAASGQTLTLGGAITANTGSFIIPTSTSSFVVNGANLTGSFPFPSGSQTVSNFTLNRPAGGITFGTQVTVSGTLTLTDGLLNFSGQSLSLGGNVLVTNGELSANNLSTLIVTGGTVGPYLIPFVSGGDIVNTLTINKSAGTVSFDGLTVTQSLNLTNGTLSNLGGLIIGNGATITRSVSTALITTNRPSVNASQTYNVSYPGTTALSTGLELPAASDATSLGNLTVSGSNTKTLSQNITINGTVALSGATFDGGANRISMRGSQWQHNIGAVFSQTGVGIVSFDRAEGTTVGGTGTPSFHNIEVTATGSLTMPNGSVNVSGDVTFNAASTFNAGTGTVNFNSTGSQVLSAGGKTMYNVLLSNGADVVLTSQLLLTNSLTIQSDNSDFNSAGFLTLVSTASNTASIGSLTGTGRTVSGNVIFQRYMAAAGRKYRDIASPVANVPVSQIISSGISITGPFTGSSFPCGGCATNNASFFYYNESAVGAQANGYVGYPTSGANSTSTFLAAGSTGASAVGRGYSLLLRNELTPTSPTISWTGTINTAVTAVSLPISYTSTSGGVAEDGWNLIGNPLPSTIDWDAALGWSKPINLQGNQINVWDPNKGASGGYRTWNGVTGDLGNGRLAAGQGFWVKMNGTGTLSLTEQVKSLTPATFYRTNSNEVDALEIVLQGDSVEDRTYLQLSQGAVMAYDNLDGPKLMNPTGGNLFSSTTEGLPMSINVFGVIPDGGEVPLALNQLNKGTYSITLHRSGAFVEQRILLIDKSTGESLALDDNEAYSLSLEEYASTLVSRFIIAFGDRTDIVTSAATRDEGIVVHPNPVEDIAYIQAASRERPVAEGLDITGIIIGHFVWSSNDGATWNGFFDMKDMREGIYFARIRKDRVLDVIKFMKK